MKAQVVFMSESSELFLSFLKQYALTFSVVFPGIKSYSNSQFSTNQYETLNLNFLRGCFQSKKLWK